MRIVQALRNLYFELAFSLTCENNVIDTLEAVSTVLEFFQVLCFMLTPNYDWNVPALQNGVKYALGVFSDPKIHFAIILAICVMNLSLAVLIWQIIRQGGISSFRVLQLARILIGLLGSFLMMPILEGCMKIVVSYLSGGTDAAASSYTYSQGAIIALLVIDIIGLLVPTFMVAYMQTPDLKHLSGFTRASTDQIVIMLALKVVIPVSYGTCSPEVFSGIMLLCQLLNLLLSFIMPPYFYPISNLLWAGQSMALVYAALVLNILVSNPPPESASTTLFIAFVGGLIPAALLGAIAFAYRLNKLLQGFSIWTCSLKHFGQRLGQLMRKRSKNALKESVKNQDLLRLAQSVSALDILNRCTFPMEVCIAANSLYGLGGVEMGDYVADILGRANKRYPQGEYLMSCWVALSASVSDNSIAHKDRIQGLIRKALTNCECSLNTRFSFYAIIKNFEITAFRQQSDDMRRLDLLSIICFHYNYTQAISNYTGALKWSLQFWKSCAAERVSVDSLNALADKIQEHQSAALHHYHILLDKFPSSISVLRSYAAYIMDCENHQRLAEDILEFADRLEEDLAERRGVQLAARQNQEETPEEARSEHASSHTKSSDLMSQLNSKSIFDVESHDEQRNGIAMGNIRRMRVAIYFSIFSLSCAVIVMYAMGTNFLSMEAIDRGLVLGASLTQCQVLWTVKNSRTLDLLLTSNGTASDILNQQVTLGGFSAGLFASLASIFYNATMTGPVLPAYWSTNSLTDISQSNLVELISPQNMFGTISFNTRMVSNSSSPGTGMIRDLLSWVVLNGISQDFYPKLFKLGKAYQTFYEQNSNFRLYTLEYVSIGLGSLPILTFIFIFVPRWNRLRHELNATGRLFTCIPRKVASVLTDEMKERMRSKLESEGVEINADDGPHHRESATAGHVGEESGASAVSSQQGQSSKSSVSLRLFLVFFIATMLILTIVIGLAVTLSNPLALFSQRASLVTYSASRYNLAYWISVLMREVSMMSPNSTGYSAWMDYLRAQTDQMMIYHQSVLFGNQSLGLIRTFGISPTVDNLTFAAACADRTPSCLSMDNAFTWVYDSVQQFSLVGLSSQAISNVYSIVNETGRLNNQILAVATLYATFYQDAVAAYNLAAVALFGFAFPASIGVLLLLRSVMMSVMARIKRTRNILWQLPPETVANIPAIRDYLNHGRLDLQEKPSPVSEQRRDSAQRKQEGANDPNALEAKATATDVNMERRVSFRGRSISGLELKGSLDEEEAIGDDDVDRSQAVTDSQTKSTANPLITVSRRRSSLLSSIDDSDDNRKRNISLTGPTPVTSPLFALPQDISSAASQNNYTKEDDFKANLK